MGYDARAIKLKKGEKTVAILSFNKERERHLIREFTKCAEKNARVKSAKNKGENDE